VDSASEVLKIPSADVEASPKVLHESELNCVTGLGKYKGRLIVLLDMTRLLDLGIKAKHGAVAETGNEKRRAAGAK
jgi:purine-binding chemotaxis protein CheW